MKVLPLEQGSPEWIEFRRNKVTATDISILMCGSQKEIYDLYQEKKGLSSKYITDSMLKGKIMEKEAIEWHFGKKKKVENPVIMHDQCDWLMASLDAFHFPTLELLEVKCTSKIPDHIEHYDRYERAYWQIQTQLYCSGLEKATLLLYSPLKQVHSKIPFNLVSFSKALEKGHEFYERLKFNNPPPEPSPLIMRTDEEAKEAAIAAKILKEQIEKLEEEWKIIREGLIYIAGDQPFECEGVKVERISSRETFDYKAMIRDFKIDESKYRKKPKEAYTWRVSV